MDNYAIADNFSLLSKLIDIHGDDSFKAKTYGVAAFNIEKLQVQLSDLPPEKIFTIPGIGKATGQKILEQIETGRLAALDEYILKTPPGLFEIMKIKGLGPKKVSTIWKELGIESLGELLYACEENRLLLYKGFGAKTQQNIKEGIEFYLSNQGSYLFSQVEAYGLAFTKKLEEQFSNHPFLITGDYNRHAETITIIEWVTDTDAASLQHFFEQQGYTTEVTDHILLAKGEENIQLKFYCVEKQQLISEFFQHNGSIEFLAAWKEQFGWKADSEYESEAALFAAHGVAFIPPYLREDPAIIAKASAQQLPTVIQVKDIKGIIHSHSNWSDGVHTIEQMAEGAIAKGLEYLVISDHSQTAFYAQGLFPDKIKAQHELIDELNIKYAPFKIFKSIESDILNDGSLDYTDAILSTFDLVIASVHSNLKMNEEKAMMRLLRAIENPYTTILGHMTGRLLLSRNGYPVDHDKIIEACAAHQVVIELNAHPRRLDVDWRYIANATEKDVLISINPDAHAIEGFEDVKYGVLVAQKAGLTALQNLSSFSLVEMEAFLTKQRQKRP